MTTADTGTAPERVFHTCTYFSLFDLWSEWELAGRIFSAILKEAIRSCFLVWWGFCLFSFGAVCCRFCLFLVAFSLGFLVRRFFGPWFWGIRDAFGSVLSLDDIVRCPGWLITTADTLHARERFSCLVCGRVLACRFAPLLAGFLGCFRIFGAAVFPLFSVGFGCFCRAFVSSMTSRMIYLRACMGSIAFH